MPIFSLFMILRRYARNPILIIKTSFYQITSIVFLGGLDNSYTVIYSTNPILIIKAPSLDPKPYIHIENKTLNPTSL